MKTMHMNLYKKYKKKYMSRDAPSANKVILDKMSKWITWIN